MLNPFPYDMKLKQGSHILFYESIYSCLRAILEACYKALGMRAIIYISDK